MTPGFLCVFVLFLFFEVQHFFQDMFIYAYKNQNVSNVSSVYPNSSTF